MDEHLSGSERSKAALVPPERIVLVGDGLRRIFDEAIGEPLPDIFEDLLRKLE